MQNRQEYTPQIGSFGGDIADLFGSLKNGKDYHGSMNPEGNPFRNDSPEKMIQRFISKHLDKDKLEITKNSLNIFYGVKPDNNYDELPENYRIANEALTKEIQKQKNR